MCVHDARCVFTTQDVVEARCVRKATACSLKQDVLSKQEVFLKQCVLSKAMCVLEAMFVLFVLVLSLLM